MPLEFVTAPHVPLAALPENSTFVDPQQSQSMVVDEVLLVEVLVVEDVVDGKAGEQVAGASLSFFRRIALVLLTTVPPNWPQ